ncbi:MAG: hypothetical protein ABJN52_14205 [Litorimonas sp.]
MTLPLIDGYSTLDNLTENEAQRFERVKVSFQIAKAELYSTQLSEIMDGPLELDVAKDPRVFHFIVTGDTTEVNPDDRDAMRALTRDVVQANELAVRNLEFSSASRRQALQDEFLSSLTPLMRLNFFRDGSLEQRTEDYVIGKLDERFV